MLPNHFISADEQAELQLFTESLERFCDAEIEPHYRTWEKAGRVPRDLLHMFEKVRGEKLSDDALLLG